MMLIKVLTTLASATSIGFGIWHFFVPAIWNWYSYIAPEATELVAAVRAINVFFSLCLVLIGVANILFLFVISHRPSLIVILSLSSILWAVRVAMQIIYPQGSMNPWLQYSLLLTFIVVFLCFTVSLIFVLLKNA